MQLHYLDFEFSDEEGGRGSFDAMASVMPERLHLLLDEIGLVLRWATDAFGSCEAGGDDGDWDYELQGSREPDRPLQVNFDSLRREVILLPHDAESRTTLTLTLGGSPAFCEAFRARFELDE
ncbi:conserved hypothetical protein [Burkholderiales bacterium 8X]|nr:conserved hypothetical protein [Burkholderiales bacterium 8X]